MSELVDVWLALWNALMWAVAVLSTMNQRQGGTCCACVHYVGTGIVRGGGGRREECACEMLLASVSCQAVWWLYSSCASRSCLQLVCD